MVMPADERVWLV